MVSRATRKLCRCRGQSIVERSTCSSTYTILFGSSKVSAGPSSSVGQQPFGNSAGSSGGVANDMERMRLSLLGNPEMMAELRRVSRNPGCLQSKRVLRSVNCHCRPIRVWHKRSRRLPSNSPGLCSKGWEGGAKPRWRSSDRFRYIRIRSRLVLKTHLHVW